MSIEIDCNQSLFRYVSEWDPRAKAHTKGGYLEGKITLPEDHDPSRPLWMTLETVPDGSLGKNLQTSSLEEFKNPPVHPLLLHVVRKGKGKRLQDEEPVPAHIHWRQEFLIEKGELYILNRTTELDFKRNIKAKDKIGKLTNGGTEITLSKAQGELNLILLLPKQKVRARNDEEATVEKVIENRLEHCAELGLIAPERVNAESVRQRCKMFTGSNSQNMKMVQLRATFRGGPGPDAPVLAAVETEDPIIDNGNKEVGALELYDVFPLKSCTRGGRKIIMISEHDLAVDRVEPYFMVFDANNGFRRKDKEKFIRQPHGENSIRVRKNTIIFISPAQPELKKHLPRDRFTIRVTMRRKQDGVSSANSGESAAFQIAECPQFTFEYVDHCSDDEDYCVFCTGKPDNNNAMESLPPVKKHSCPNNNRTRPSVPTKRKQPTSSLLPAQAQKMSKRQHIDSENSSTSSTDEPWLSPMSVSTRGSSSDYCPEDESGGGPFTPSPHRLGRREGKRRSFEMSPSSGYYSDETDIGGESPMAPNDSQTSSYVIQNSMTAPPDDALSSTLTEITANLTGSQIVIYAAPEEEHMAEPSALASASVVIEQTEFMAPAVNSSTPSSSSSSFLLQSMNDKYISGPKDFTNTDLLESFLNQDPQSFVQELSSNDFPGICDNIITPGLQDRPPVQDLGDRSLTEVIGRLDEFKEYLCSLSDAEIVMKDSSSASALVKRFKRHQSLADRDPEIALKENDKTMPSGHDKKADADVAQSTATATSVDSELANNVGLKKSMPFFTWIFVAVALLLTILRRQVEKQEGLVVVGGLADNSVLDAECGIAWLKGGYLLVVSLLLSLVATLIKILFDFQFAKRSWLQCNCVQSGGKKVQ